MILSGSVVDVFRDFDLARDETESKKAVSSLLLLRNCAGIKGPSIVSLFAIFRALHYCRCNAQPECKKVGRSLRILLCLHPYFGQGGEKRSDCFRMSGQEFL